MKDNVIVWLKKYRSIILTIFGAVILSSPILFLDSTFIAGLLSTIGILSLFMGGKFATTKLEIILNGVLLWIGISIRFSGVFGNEFLYTLCQFLSNLPYCIFLVGSMFAGRLLYKKGYHILSVLVIPVAYTLGAVLYTMVNLGFVYNIMTYTMSIPVISSNLSLLGEFGLTFVLMLIFTCFLAIWSEPRKKTKIVFASVSLVLSFSLILNGVIVRSGYSEPDYTISAALATSQEMNFTGEEGVEYTLEQQLEMFNLALKQAYDKGADLLVLNEEYFCFYDDNIDFKIEEISRLISIYGIPTLIGLEVVHQDDYYTNEAIFFDGEGKILYTYIKNNLVPLVESGVCEDGPEEPALIQTTIGGHLVSLAFVICLDINDEFYLRKIPSDTELLIVPSWDWDTVNIEQKRTALRSATLNLTVLKHTFDGFSFVACPNGDVSEVVDFRGSYETVKMVSVPVWEK